MAVETARAGEVVGWMEIDPRGGQIRITGRAWSAAPMRIEYSLQIRRSGRSGNATTRQGGRAELSGGATAEIGNTSVNMGPDDQIAVLLTIASGGNVLATSGIHVGAPETPPRPDEPR